MFYEHTTRRGFASMSFATDHFVDVQSHFLPDFYVAAMRGAGIEKIDNWNIPQWSVESAIAMMDSFGIAAQILSLSAPGTTFLSGQPARDLARALNEFAASTIRDHAPRFGAFATLPLPDVDGALAELDYALDSLQLDGVGILTNYSGLYLGQPEFDPIFDELNRRRAVVFVHPVAPPNFAPLGVGLTAPILEYPFDTARMVANLLRSGTIERCPDMRLIVAHGGGPIPSLAPRLALPLGKERVTLLSNFYYDLTAATMPGQLAGLSAIARPDHLLMGFDFPFMTPAMNQPFRDAFKQSSFSAEDRAAITSGNALRLFLRVAERLNQQS
jgi:predicted TIM-barrel fold metal-dependent hydrolase